MSRMIEGRNYDEWMEEFVADLKNDKIKTCYECTGIEV